ncbi:MAG: FHA domain-containing protein [Proteobacteria bacterium]|nr:MAG: FHA domain-containing protein [Pseudomonadota bacterium]
METETAWLKSPVTQRAEQLRPYHRLELVPFRGPKRAVELIRTRYVIGSDPDCDIQIKDPYISPKHAEISILDGCVGFAVKDLNSRNGIFLNGVQVSQAPLPVRGSLRLGRSTFAWNPESENEVPDTAYIAADPAMREAIQSLKRMAQTSLPVLLLGETGTGKDVLARLIHQWSRFSRGPYVAVNGALTGGSLSESELFGHRKGAFTGAEKARMGALRSANGGTLFLDEVADIPPAAQVKLLRSLENGEVRPLGSDDAERSEFRLISATSQNIDGRVADGSFRMDLFFRVAGHVVHVPPLRDRPLDILAMARRWLSESDLILDSESEACLLTYRWPGNVRELKACLERASVHARGEGSQVVLVRHLADLAAQTARTELPAQGPTKTLDEMEREWILAALDRHGWSRSLAAAELGVARSTLFHKMKRFSLRDAPMVVR